MGNCLHPQVIKPKSVTSNNHQTKPSKAPKEPKASKKNTHHIFMPGGSKGGFRH